MRRNFIQTGLRGTDQRTYIDGDWFSHGIPSNVLLAKNVYIDTSYGFAGFRSQRSDALFIDEGSGCYDRASFIVGEKGKIRIGKFSILNGSTIICNTYVQIGDHCMLAWGSVITDSWLHHSTSIKLREDLLVDASKNDMRHYPLPPNSSPITIEDNVWVGFDSVILPGVRLGRGSVVGCKTIIESNVPPYAVIAGSPPRIIKYLDPSDTDEAKHAALNQYLNTR